MVRTLRIQNVPDELLARIKARAHREHGGVYDIAAIARHLLSLYADHGMAALDATVGTGFVLEKADGPVPPNDQWGNR